MGKSRSYRKYFRSKVIGVYLSPGEHTVIMETARRNGLTVSAMARLAMLRLAEDQGLKPEYEDSE